MGQPLPRERGRGRVRGGNREVPPATLEGGTRGKRSFPPRERVVGERRSSFVQRALERRLGSPELVGGERNEERAPREPPLVRQPVLEESIEGKLLLQAVPVDVDVQRPGERLVPPPPHP